MFAWPTLTLTARSRAASWRRGGRSCRLPPRVGLLLVLFQPTGREQNQPILKTISEHPAGLTFPFLSLGFRSAVFRKSMRVEAALSLFKKHNQSFL